MVATMDDVSLDDLRTGFDLDEAEAGEYGRDDDLTMGLEEETGSEVEATRAFLKSSRTEQSASKQPEKHLLEGGIPTVVVLGLSDAPWQAKANCMGVDPDLFFPERGASAREAKEVCRGCVVREDCLRHALSNGERFGIWGGLSERERRRMRRLKPEAREEAITKLMADVPYVAFVGRRGPAKARPKLTVKADVVSPVPPVPSRKPEKPSMRQRVLDLLSENGGSITNPQGGVVGMVIHQLGLKTPSKRSYLSMTLSLMLKAGEINRIGSGVKTTEIGLVREAVVALPSTVTALPDPEPSAPSVQEPPVDLIGLRARLIAHLREQDDYLIDSKGKIIPDLHEALGLTSQEDHKLLLKLITVMVNEGTLSHVVRGGRTTLMRLTALAAA
jgi:WhiB family redox-sensing transcriptional regulator